MRGKLLVKWVKHKLVKADAGYSQNNSLQAQDCSDFNQQSHLDLFALDSLHKKFYLPFSVSKFYKRPKN